MAAAVLVGLAALGLVWSSRGRPVTVSQFPGGLAPRSPSAAAPAVPDWEPPGDDLRKLLDHVSVAEQRLDRARTEIREGVPRHGVEEVLDTLRSLHAGLEPLLRDHGSDPAILELTGTGVSVLQTLDYFDLRMMIQSEPGNRRAFQDGLERIRTDLSRPGLGDCVEPVRCTLEPLVKQLKQGEPLGAREAAEGAWRAVQAIEKTYLRRGRQPGVAELAATIVMLGHAGLHFKEAAQNSPPADRTKLLEQRRRVDEMALALNDRIADALRRLEPRAQALDAWYRSRLGATLPTMARTCALRVATDRTVARKARAAAVRWAIRTAREWSRTADGWWINSVEAATWMGPRQDAIRDLADTARELQSELVTGETGALREMVERLELETEMGLALRAKARGEPADEALRARLAALVPRYRDWAQGQVRLLFGPARR